MWPRGSVETTRDDGGGLTKKQLVVNGYDFSGTKRSNQRSKCNTPGVCHQLSSVFELKHDRLSGDEDIKVKLMEKSPNQNLDIAPLLYI
jgi:hypothetical protein